MFIVSVFDVVATPHGTGLSPNHSSTPTTFRVALAPGVISAVTVFVPLS
jgi:hypothetical protein